MNTEAKSTTLVPGAEMVEREGLRKIVKAHDNPVSREVDEPTCSTPQL